MEKKKLSKIKLAIENFFYKIRFNIALHKAYKSEYHQSFQNKLKTALKKQTFYYATVEKVSLIAGTDEVSKVVDDIKKNDLLSNLLDIWLPLADLLSREDLHDFLVSVANTSGQFALGKLNSREKFELVNETILKRIDKRVDMMLKEVDSTTQDWIARTVKDGISRGDSFVDIAKNIRKKATEFILMRSELIAQQESAVILGSIELEVFKRNKVQFVKWITSRDEKVCPRCNSNESAGETPIGEKFPTGVTSTPDHIRCRCFIMPVIPYEHKIIWTGQ